MKYVVTIMEILHRDVVVEAEDTSEACEKVAESYYAEDIVLGASDYADTNFDVRPYVCESDFRLDFLEDYLEM